PCTTLCALRPPWDSYKCHFMPWLALNLCYQHRRSSGTFLPENSQDKIITDEDIFVMLLKVFETLFINDLSKQTHILALCPEIRHKYLELPTPELGRPCVRARSRRCQHVCSPEEVHFNTLGFSIAQDQSSLLSAGTAVFLSKGFVPKGTVVSMYSGTVYRKYEPIFFQSLGNPFNFRCIYGVLIDGNDKGLSRAVSCSRRDWISPLQTSDASWLTAALQNLLAIGQYVNNCSRKKAANVCYQEFDVLGSFPVELKQYLPNTVYRHNIQ
ncbi:SETD9 protein, partial [Crypturellus undulatus]|nr:SETD9 protein [Crypturellus undulatus]